MSDNKVISKINLYFPSKDEAINIMLNSDDFLTRMLPNERKIILNTYKDISLEDFKIHVAKQVTEYTDREKKYIIISMKKIEKELNDFGYKILLPDKINMIKTTGLEDIPETEGYCKKDTIVLMQESFGKKSKCDYMLLVHELFHIHSQNDSVKREKYYNILGYEMCNEIELPEFIHNKRLSNPDAPFVNVRIELTYNNSKVWATPISLFDIDTYVEYMIIEKENDRWIYKKDTLLFNGEKCPDFFDKIGRNTTYNDHPEEIFACNFEILFSGETYPDKEIMRKFVELLKN